MTLREIECGGGNRDDRVDGPLGILLLEQRQVLGLELRARKPKAVA